MMANLGSEDYRVGLIVARTQPFHNGHLKAITDALMKCDEVIFCVLDYNDGYFDYNIAQKSFRKIFGIVDRVAFFGTEKQENVIIPKAKLENILNKLEHANYNMPTHFFTTDTEWIEPAKELQLQAVRVSTLPEHNSAQILAYIQHGLDTWKEKVPYSIIETLETYIATKNRNF